MFGSVTTMTHNMIKENIKKQMLTYQQLIGIDATMGNGNDTLFMSQLIGEKGQVLAFDIQSKALENTTQLLGDKNVTNVNLIHDGHEKMSEYTEYADLIMFNLGYLPKGDHQVITKPDTTLRAIKSGLNLLRRGGLMTVIVYYGHEGGDVEKIAVEEFFQLLDVKRFEVLRVDKYNRPNNPPIALFVKKLAS